MSIASAFGIGPFLANVASVRERPSLVVIGAGSSSFGLSALRELYGEPVLAGATLWLVDVDAARIEQTAHIAAVFEDVTGRGIEVRRTTDRAEALPGADAVIVAVEVERQNRWEQDAEICRAHGVRSVLAENAGPGGLSHAMRTIPLVAAIARDVQRLAPEAWLLNFTNPEGRVCTALRRYLPDVRAVGLCHEVRLAQDRHLRMIGRGRDDFRWRAGGLNHITALLECRDVATGEDCMPLLRESLDKLLADEYEGPHHQLVDCLQRNFDVLVATTDNHVGEYLAFAADHTPIEDVREWGGGIRSAEEALVTAVLGGRSTSRP
jgi:alpha-galactosidase